MSDGLTPDALHACLLICERPVPFTFAQLFNELKRIKPDCRISSWGQEFTAPPPADARFDLIEIDGEPVSIRINPAPTPDDIFDTGTPINIYLPDPRAACVGNKAHIQISGPSRPDTRDTALKKARAVTLVVFAVARVVPTMAALWIESLNIIPGDMLPALEDEFKKTQTAVVLWLRVLVAPGPTAVDGTKTVITASRGLAAFSPRDVEFITAGMALDVLLHHLFTLADIIIQHRPNLLAERRYEIVPNVKFAIEDEAQGLLMHAPVYRLMVAA